MDLDWCTFCSLLACDSTGLSLGGAGCGLCFLSLLQTLSCGFLLLALLDGGCAGGVTGFGALGTTLFDYIERGTDDSTLGLDGAAGSLLGNFL